MARKIIVIGSLNMDFAIRVPMIPVAGETVMTTGSYVMNPGGKGANQAVAVALLGGNVSMVGRVGQDFLGEQLIENLQSAGVNVNSVYRASGYSTGVAFITVDEGGHNAIAVSAGANQNLSAEDLKEELLVEADYVLLQLEVPLRTVETALHKAGDCIRILDPAPAQPLPSALLNLVDILTPNESETMILLGERPRRVQSDEVEEIAGRIQQMGPAAVIIKLGDRGCFVNDREGNSGWIPAPRVRAVDSTAAGDVFNGALAVALSEGQSLREAAVFASHAGALSVTRIGAQSSSPTRAELDEFMRAIQPSK